MKKYLLQTARTYQPLLMAIVFGFSSILGSAQTNVSIAPIKMNVLYIGVDNPVSVAAAGSTDEKVTVSITGGGGSISKIDAGLYNVRVTTATNDCILNVFVDGKLAGSSKFRVRMLPEPSATVGGFMSGDKVTADILRTQTGLGVFVKNSPFEIKYEVTSFSVKLADDKGNLKTSKCQGNLFSSEAKQLIDQFTKPGDIVTIENIMAKDDSGREFKLPALMYFIK